MPFCDLLTSGLTAAGLTQGELAMAIGVTPGAVGHWTRGIRRPSPRYLPAISEALRWTKTQQREAAAALAGLA